MDSVVIMWAFILLLPIIITTALCIHCREGAPTRITQSVDDYEYNPTGMMSPGSHSSFTVLRPSNYVHTGVSTSFPAGRPDPFLSATSLHHPESRRNSSAKPEPDNDSTPNYENAAEPDYSNDDYSNGYIEVLPDNTDVSICQSVLCESGTSITPSSTGTGDYQNVPEQQSDSPCEDTSTGDSLDYVNMPQMQEPAQPNDPYDDISNHGSNNDDDDDDTPDYENVEKKSRGDQYGWLTSSTC